MTVATTHANYSHDWHTPKEWLDWVTRTLGDGWFDPCPPHWQPDDEDGLHAYWRGPTYVNHPGTRASVARDWWAKGVRCLRERQVSALVWCAFNSEQLRYLDPSPFHLDGWLIMPRDRIGFVWGGPDVVTPNGKSRLTGDVARSPSNWTVFWSSCAPARTPTDCVIVRTGK